MSSNTQLPPSPEGYPVIGHTIDFGDDPFGFVDRATSECGDVYCMELPGTDVYVLAGAEYLEQALVTDVDAFGKTDDFNRVFGNGVLSTEGEQWSRQRGILQPLFHPERVSGYAGDMVAATQRRLATWNDGERLDIESEMQDLTIEILFATLFGRDLAPGEGDDLRDASDGLNKWFVPTSWLLPHWIPTPSRHEFSNSESRLRVEIRRLLAEYEYADKSGTVTLADQVEQSASESQLDGSESETLLSKLSEAAEATGDEHLSPEEIEDQMLTMIFAGYETTASAIAFALYSLATEPDVRAAFHEELDAVLDGRAPTRDDISRLDLTNRIVTETLRLYPPIHTIPRQTTREVDVGRYRLPSDEQVHLSVISVHRDERYYDAPLEFYPDRWTDGYQEELDDHAFIPFGGGRRTCIGREFARLEATLALATIGQQFDLEWNGDETDIAIEPEMTTKTQNGLPMTLRER
ncbi:cytochrome P450 (plasmid) [Halococcus dombrowskii]|uniref:Cytochrome P450 n=1 Tax=Halococcus dombrowskii TaxID=179637 RepID=A0AAV3SGF3_HALDO|nr:cytochrome P450 [Halococcus dombrowskii]UOO97162.1 cytochrome P450 [Halococcus dombrowskii]